MTIAPYDLAAFLIGAQHTGKSTLGQHLALREMGAGVAAFVHDVKREMVALGPMYPSVASYRDAFAVARAERRALPLGARFPPTVELVALLELAVWSVGQRKRPALAFIDETIFMGDRRRGWPRKAVEIAVDRRGHKLGLLVGSQTPRFIPDAVLGFYTDLYLFRCATAQQVATLAELYVPRSVLDELPFLPDRRYHHVITGGRVAHP